MFFFTHSPTASGAVLLGWSTMTFWILPPSVSTSNFTVTLPPAPGAPLRTES